MAIKGFPVKKNLILNSLFLLLIATSLIAALIIAWNFTSKYVYNEFERKKTEVVDETVKPYNDFFQNKIPEISLYQGYLDSASAAKFASSVFVKFPFVSSIVFYDTEISNHYIPYAYQARRLTIAPKQIIEYHNQKDLEVKVVFKGGVQKAIPASYVSEFNREAARFSAYLQSDEGHKEALSGESYDTFYNIASNRITYMNIARDEEIKAFRDLMKNKRQRSPAFQQDILTFFLDPQLLNIRNSHPHFYQDIKIIPLTSDILDVDTGYVSTEFPLSGGFGNYKLHFRSTPDFLSKEILRRYLPLAAAIVLVYGLISFIGFLIYRNLSINNKLFKLQYDFVNNLTHEFKTPVSVIKIAGNNIRRAKQLSDKERMHYGKILDEEADKLNDLMNKLLSFTQIENQSIKLKCEDINMEIFVQNLVDAYQIKYQDFEINHSIRDVDYFFSDPVLLGSLFQNLIDNAYKYSLPGKKQLHIDIALEKADIVFRFTDQGIGIPNDELKNIFKKFYRIQSEYNQQGSVGLGLAFCKELVNFMNGDISVKSRPGLGSEFIIILPFNKTT